MKKLLIAVSCLAIVTVASAAPVDITVNMGYNRDYNYVSMAENGNVDFGSNNEQEFDLESFSYNKLTGELSMQSGFDIESEHLDYYDGAFHHNTLGDIFIDVGGSEGFEYAVKFNRDIDTELDDFNYSIIDLTVGYTDLGLLDEYDGVPVDHSEAMPFAVDTYNGAVLGNGTFLYDDFADEEGAHYVMSGINIGDVVDGRSFSVRQTIRCGNDIMVGSVPEPTIISLLGFSFLGLAFYRRRK